MIHFLTPFIEIDKLLWGYCGFTLIFLLGCYFSFKSRFFQISSFPSLIKQFFSYLSSSKDLGSEGVHPIKILFASVGGTVGIGNLVGIVTAVQIGGPGALFWAWIAALFGSLVKYSEVYLGLKHRVATGSGYSGGPMYFLQKAFKSALIPGLVALLLCVYGVEIYQFNVVVDSIANNWGWDRLLVSAGLTLAVIWAGFGGVKRVAKISSFLLPIFILMYLLMGFFVIALHIGELGEVLGLVFKSAFTGHAALGGFAGSTLLLALQQGIARSAYSADLGIGNDSVIQSESSLSDPKAQARLSIVGVFIDNFVCTMTILLILVTGVWQTEIASSEMIQNVLSAHFPGMHLFIPLFFLILGYTTTIAYFSVGLKAAAFLHPKFGFVFYLPLAAFFLFLFSFFDQSLPLLVMSLSGGMLVIINLIGILRLRKEVEF